MHLEFDYTKEKEAEMAAIEEMEKKLRGVEAKIPEDLLKRILNYDSQFEIVPNSGKKNRIVWLYEKLTDIAYINGGHVILDVNEEHQTAKLVYKGKSLIRICEEGDLTGVVFAALFLYFDPVFLTHEDKYFVFTVEENLYDKVLVRSSRDESDSLDM